MSQLIRVIGRASGKTIGAWACADPRENLLDFLRRNGVPVASSCGGEGVCQKCTVNQDLVSCQISVGAFLQSSATGVVEISYL